MPGVSRSGDALLGSWAAPSTSEDYHALLHVFLEGFYPLEGDRLLQGLRSVWDLLLGPLSGVLGQSDNTVSFRR